MIRIEHAIKIDRPAGEVFSYVADSRNDPEWCPPVLEVEQTAGTGPEAGATYRYVAKPGPRKLQGYIEITAMTTDERAEYEGENDALRFHYVYRFIADGQGTTLDMTSELTPKGFWRLLTPIIRAATKKVTVEEFGNLKRLLESRSAG